MIQFKLSGVTVCFSKIVKFTPGNARTITPSRRSVNYVINACNRIRLITSKSSSFAEDPCPFLGTNTDEAYEGGIIATGTAKLRFSVIFTFGLSLP
jgi:hypothetical protein